MSSRVLRWAAVFRCSSPKVNLAVFDPEAFTYGGASDGKQELEEVEVEQATDDAFNIGPAWHAWAGVELDMGYNVTAFEDALCEAQDDRCHLP